MDGTLRQTLVHENIQWPTGLAVDYFNERLYWADAKLSVIGSVHLNGSDPVIAVTGLKNNLLHPFSIDIFEDYIYGVTYINNFVFRVNKFGKGPMENLTTGINHATDIVLYNRYKQPEMTNPCDRKKCEWLCLLSPSGPAKCQCQSSFTGERCEVNQCRDYCKNGGACTASVAGAPTCRCLKGFTGPQCNLHTCQDYCHNGGNCTVSQGNQPTCHCPPEYLGDQCQYSKCEDYCKNEGKCLQTANSTKLCRCPPQFHGQLCELDNCPNGQTQPSCYTCLDFCTKGLCSIQPRTLLPQCKCPIEWRGYRCEVIASPVDSPVSSGSLHGRANAPDVLVLRRNKLTVCVCVHSAKGFQHHRMTNGAMNVEIGNPAYKIYEGEPDDDAGELLDSDFALDPDKPTNFTNPVYATLYMGAHNSRNSLASTDEKKELLSQGDDGEDEDMSDPLA
ncbi:unnamed protein product [Coregonus sp. 'balchen']|nr:unnamed protein product [Coregonus sp. 'balchen']